MGRVNPLPNRGGIWGTQKIPGQGRSQVNAKTHPVPLPFLPLLLHKFTKMNLSDLFQKNITSTKKNPQIK